MRQTEKTLLLSIPFGAFCRFVRCSASDCFHDWRVLNPGHCTPMALQCQYFAPWQQYQGAVMLMQGSSCLEAFFGVLATDSKLVVERKAPLIPQLTLRASLKQSIGTSTKGTYR